jgi:archaeal type IV pilus assembly protein PilA
MVLTEWINRREPEEAVSPVVGVMLMLVVTIIIAAVVSGFAGGLIGGNNQKVPTLAMDVKIANTGSALTSGFSASVLSISEPTATKNLKITTSWVTTLKDNTTSSTRPNGTAFGGGATSYLGSTSTPAGAPYGFGPGVSGEISLNSPYNENQYFGNFTLTQGTSLVAEPASGYTNYGYLSGSAMSAVLGTGWEQLRPGDIVTLRVIHTPTGKAIFQKDVAVTGA